ncbi:MAG: PD40 domain-containing protein [Phycisphaerales bacterium]|nr:PD40 domain-containing protein [Phycisphaerales bacterium]
MRTELNAALRPIIILALAGSVSTLAACGPKRGGFWKKDANTASKNTSNEALPLARTNAYFASTREEVPQVATSGLSSNASASIEYAMAAEKPAHTPTVSADWENTKPIAQSQPTIKYTQPTQPVQAPSNISYSVSTPTAFESQVLNHATTPSTSSSTTNQFQSQDTQTKTAASTSEPYFTNDSTAPAGLRSGDLSALIYSNAMGAELPSESSSNATHATLNVRQITRSFAGTDFDPVITPDGQNIIFASTQHRPTADIYIKSINGNVVTRLTDDPAQDVMPAISPDGRFIAFSSDRNGSWDLYIMPSDGGKVVQLTNESTHDLHPSWSSDGTKLVFSRLGEQTGRWEMWAMDVNASSGAQFIGFGLFPEWCPVAGTGVAGSDQILFQRSRERGDRAFGVWTMDYDPNTGNAGRETEIANGPNQALINPTWSPDGKFICFAAVPNSESWAKGTNAQPESSTLWMVSTQGTGKVKLTDGRAIDIMPAWGRNNDIVFVSNMDGQEHLWSMELSPAVRAASVQIPDINSSFATVPTEGPNAPE